MLINSYIIQNDTLTKIIRINATPDHPSTHYIKCTYVHIHKSTQIDMDIDILIDNADIPGQNQPI